MNAGGNSTACTVRMMPADDWQTIRGVRLRALKEAPTAFGSGYEDQSKLTDAQWIEWVRQLTDAKRPAAWLGFVDDEPVGMAVCASDRELVDRGWLVSVWVAPTARQRGVGRTLITHVIEWARHVPYQALHLHVTEGNTPATRLYRRMGFEMTGDTMPHPRIDNLLEHEMRLVIRS